MDYQPDLLVCLDCSERFSDLEALDRHTDTVHPETLQPAPASHASHKVWGPW